MPSELPIIESHDGITVASTSDSAEEVTAATGRASSAAPQPPPSDQADKTPTSDAAPAAAESAASTELADNQPAADSTADETDDNDENTEESDEPEPDTDAEAERQRRRRGGRDRRIRALTRQNAQLQRRLEALEAGEPRATPSRTANSDETDEADEEKDQSSQAGQSRPAASQDPNRRPEPGDYATYEEYVDRLMDWRLEQRDAQRQAQAAQQQRQTAWQQRVEAAKAEYGEDFEDVAFSEDTPMSRAMTETILDSPVGAHVAYFLGQHPDEAERISLLPPLAAAREIGKIEARFSERSGGGNAAASAPTPASSTTPTEPARPKPRVSSSPDPIRPVSGRGTGKVVKNPDDMSPEEYRAWRESGGGR